jgi:hypothetical protein
MNYFDVGPEKPFSGPINSNALKYLSCNDESTGL